MATNVGSIVYTVALDLTRLLGGQRDVARILDRTGGEGERLQTRFTKVAAGISAALASIAVGELLSKVVSVQRQFDVMFASLTTVTGGVDQAGAAFDRLRKFAAQTPYTLQQSVDGFVKLKALGLDPSERAMMSFGNTASAMGKNLIQMVEAVADASTGEFERLKEFGIKANAEGNKVALTFRGTTTTVANSASAITEYLVKIGETDFAGAMSARMKTLDGDISNLGDSWDQLFLTVSQSGVGQAIASGVRMATEAIQQADASVKNGELTEYFAALLPVIEAGRLAAATFAAYVAGQLVAALVNAAVAVRAKSAATAEATLAEILHLKALQSTAVNAAAAATAARASALATAEQAAANVLAARASVQLLAAQAEQAAMNTRLAAGSAAHFQAAAVERTVTIQLAAAKVAETEATVALTAAERALAVARGQEAAAAVAATASTVALTAAQRAQTLTAGLAAVAGRAFGSVVAALGGPIGVAITALALLAFNWDKVWKAAESAADISERSADRIRKALSGSTAAPMRALQDALAAAQKGMAVEEALAKRAQARAGTDRQGRPAKADTAAIDARREAFRAAAIDAQKAIDDLKEQQVKGLFPTSTEEKPRPDKPRPDKPQRTKDAFDAAGYMASLERQTLEGVDRIDAIEQEALRKNAQLLAQKKITAAQAAQAITLIESNAAEDRQAIQRAHGEDIRQAIERQGEEEAAIAARQAEDRKRAQEIATGIAIGDDPIARLQYELEQKSAMLAEYAALDQENIELYAAARVAVEQQTAQQIMEIRQRQNDEAAAAQSAQLMGMSAAFGGMADATRQFAGEQNGIYKTLFAAQKAFAIASSIIAIQTGIAKAQELGFPANLAAMASVIASTASVISTITGTNYGGGRQYGGAVSASSLYRVNEGGRPEMFQASNGDQYMMPTSSGQVIPAGEVGGGSSISIHIENTGTPQRVVSQDYDGEARMLRLVTADLSSQIANNSGPVWSALRSSSNVTGKL